MNKSKYYTINEVYLISGVTPKALRHYEKLGLLIPKKRSDTKYRLYDLDNLTTLQQILFYKELALPLKEIKKLLYRQTTLTTTLEHQITLLKDKINHLNNVLTTAYQILEQHGGKNKMSVKEQFKVFKEKHLKEHDELYRNESIEKYGQETYQKSRQKVDAIDEETFTKVTELEQKAISTFIKAFDGGDPTSALALEAVNYHQKWLMFYWHAFSKEAYLGLVQMYLDDERFTKYYDQHCEGLTKFIFKAVHHWCSIN